MLFTLGLAPEKPFSVLLQLSPVAWDCPDVRPRPEEGKTEEFVSFPLSPSCGSSRTQPHHLRTALLLRRWARRHGHLRLQGDLSQRTDGPAASAFTSYNGRIQSQPQLPRGAKRRGEEEEILRDCCWPIPTILS